jgi:CheY-like chemotaxis protein
VQSEVGVGSTFGFTLPAQALDEARGEPESPPPAGRSVVLVIEDDPTSVDLLDVYLEGTGWELTVARNGTDGLDAVRRLKPDAVVLDIRLPGLFGWDVLAAIKADAATADIPVVVTSVMDDRTRGMSLGAAAYLVKPISRDALVGALAKVLDGGRLASTSEGDR